MTTTPATLQFTLANGLRVILHESHSSPVVAFQAWVGVGSADEPEELAGIAHVFEHMLFKGTARRGVGKIAQEVEGAGGDINAWTSFDETVYHLVLASRYFDTGLDILTDALCNSSFDPGELERELKVILEEVKQGEDSPSRVATQSLFSTAYTNHTYRRPVIGFVRTVEKFTRPQLLEFFRAHYTPDNITLVVVGDFDANIARGKIEGAWKGASAAMQQMPPRPVEPPQAAPRAHVTTSDVRETHVSIAFHVPGLVAHDTAPLDVGAIVLGQGDSSRLHREVKRNRQIVTEVYSYSYSPRDPGLLVIGATLPPADLDAAIDAMLDETLRLAHEDAAAEEIEKAKTIVESDIVYTKETVQGFARKLGFFATISGPGKTSLTVEDDYHRRLREVTPRALREAWTRYVRLDNASISVLAPQTLVTSPEAARALEASLLERLAAGWKRAEDRFAARPASSKDAITRTVLPSGTHVVIARDPSVPLVAMRAVWLGGLRAEDARTNGISNLLAALVTRGTATRTAEALAHEVESMAGSIGGFTGRNSFGARVEVMARHADKGLDILLDCLLHPAFADEELDRERRQVLEEIRTQEDNISSVAFRLFGEALYPHHPYRLDPLGTPATVAAFTRRDLADYYARHFTPAGLTIAIVGDVDPAAIIAHLSAALGPAPVGDSPRSSIAQPPIDPPPESPRRVERVLNKQQAHVVVGFPGTTLASRDRYTLEVLSTILSGQGGRLFVELRDKRGLAYRVSAFSLEGLDPGYFAVYIATSPTNLAVAESGIRAELDKVIDHPVDSEELARAQRYLVGAHDISLQRRSALASTLAFNDVYGLGWDDYTRYAENILAITAGDVQRVARQYLDPRRAVIAVVKPDDAPPHAHRPDSAVAAHRAAPHKGKTSKKKKAQKHKRAR